MQLPVLLLVPSSDGLRNISAGVTADASESGLPSSVTMDLDFAPVPLNLTDSDTPIADFAASDSAGSFVVRGFIDASLDDPPTEIDGVAVYADPEVQELLTCITTPPVGTSDDVAQLLDVSSLGARGLDGTNVAIGIVDGGINLDFLTTALGAAPSLDTANSWTPPKSTKSAGTYKVGHGTMCAFDVLIAAPNATLIDLPVLSVAQSGGSIMSGYLSAALSAYVAVLNSWNVAGTGSGLDQYSAVVLSNSWGIFNPSWDFPAGHAGRYCDNPKHPFNLILETMARGGVDVIFAAGNCGADCPDGRCKGRTIEAIMGASASVDTFSIAGCDTNGDRVGYSSQGPSIAGMYGNKPDLSGYTHFLGSKAFGASKPDSGTSAACPVIAGCIAAIRTKADPRSPLTPYMLYDHFRTNATPAQGGSAGWGPDYGHGIVNVIAVADQLGFQ